MWFSKYLKVYDKTIDTVPQEVFDEIKEKIASKQSLHPFVSIVLIGYNEEKRLLASLWSLSEMICKYPVEIIGVDNMSTDRTAEIFERCGIPYYTETRRSCGWARNCGLNKAQGIYHINIDADTMYPPEYIEMMVDALEKPDVVAVSSLWSYIPDEKHPSWFLNMYEFLRDTHLWIQHFSRPELSVRGLVFGYNTEIAKKVGIRTDIIRGEDGSLALGLKKYGKISFLRNRKARAVTCYRTLSADGSPWRSLRIRLWKQIINITSYLFPKTAYIDDPGNLVNKK